MDISKNIPDDFKYVIASSPQVCREVAGFHYFAIFKQDVTL